MLRDTAIDRRAFVAGAGAGLVALAVPGHAARAAAPPLARVICDNDWSGDPDGLFQLVQHLLSPAIDLPLIVGSHLPGGGAFGSATSATDAASEANALLRVMRREGQVPVVAGAELAMTARDTWQPSPATATIVAEAMREDASGPLVYCAGASLTELALAWLAEPRIGPRLRLIWIGGNEHAGLAYPPPDPDPVEFNLGLDLVAAQVVFNESDIEVWQVPRDAYRQLLFSHAELAELAESGPLGRYLTDKVWGIEDVLRRIMPDGNFARNEAYVLGDSPLVTLSVLHSFFNGDPSSSFYHQQPTPRVLDNGSYQPRADARPMRVYTRIDTRLTFADMTAKIRAEDRRLMATGG